jgi:predicted acylesterase/phospholipase RssA
MFMEEKPTSPPPEGKSPGDGNRRPFRVFSFPGAGFDTVFHMGVVHALVVTRREAPDMVAGVSVGSITATVLGDVLTTGAGKSEKEIEQAQVARFNELMEAFRNAPNTVLKGFFPDPLETNSSHALKPVELPRHFQEEREGRGVAVASRTGLIRLLDQVLRIKVTVKLIAQLTRVFMGWRESGEMAVADRLCTRGYLLLKLWWLIARNIFALAMPVSLLAGVQLKDLLGIKAAKVADGVEAGHIIFNRGAWMRRARDFVIWLFLGFLPLALSLALVPGLLVGGLGMCLWPGWTDLLWTEAGLLVLGGVALSAWGALFLRKNASSNLLKHFHIYSDLGDSHALKEALVQSFDPGYYGEFRFDESVRRALKEEHPGRGETQNRKSLAGYNQGPRGIIVAPIAANLGTGQLESLPATSSVVDALMCACAWAPYFKAQTIPTPMGPATFIDGNSVSKDPIVPVFEEACRRVANRPVKCWNSLRIISAPLLPVKRDDGSLSSEPMTGLVDVALRASDLQRYQDMLLDKGLIDRLNRALNGKPATIADETTVGETFFPAKIRLVAPERPLRLSLRLMQAGSATKQREMIGTTVADGCRAMIERLVTDALPDTRTPERAPYDA